MSPLAIGGLAFAALLALLAMGVPVALAMGTVAAVGLYLTIGERFLFSTFESLPYTLGSEYTFVVVPMFVLMGGLAARAGIIGDLYTAAHRFLERVRGNLLMATVLAQAAFAAASGSTVVASSVFTRMALPEMQRFRYNGGVSAGCIAAAGTLAGLIPPSIAMVLFAVLTGEPIGALLIAGILPGLLTAVGYLVGIRVMLIFKPDWAPPMTERYSVKAKLQSLSRVWSILILMGLVMGGIYAGWFPPSAAGAVGAAGALVIGLAMRRLTGQDIWEALIDAAKITCVIFLIVMAGLLFSRFLVISGFIGELRSFVLASELGIVGFLAITVVIFLILGMFIDSVSLLVVTVPFLFPISQALGLDPIWFGVLVVKLIEIAAITPPVGLNLFAVLAAAEGKVESGALFKGVLPFLAVEVVVLGLLLAFPGISTWLPMTMGV
ncbi:MAG: TRAP transporter large permease [Pseudomonadota bacterium]